MKNPLRYVTVFVVLCVSISACMQKTLKIEYQGKNNPQSNSALPGASGLSLYIYPFEDRRPNKNAGLHTGFVGWGLDLQSTSKPADIIQEALVKRLKNSGVQIASDPGHADMYIKGAVILFEGNVKAQVTSGSYQSRATAEVQVFYKSEPTPIWVETVRAENEVEAKKLGFTADETEYGDSFSGTVTKLVDRVVENPSFSEALLKPKQ